MESPNVGSARRKMGVCSAQPWASQKQGNSKPLRKNNLLKYVLHCKHRFCKGTHDVPPLISPQTHHAQNKKYRVLTLVVEAGDELATRLVITSLLTVVQVAVAGVGSREGTMGRGSSPGRLLLLVLAALLQLVLLTWLPLELQSRRSHPAR